MKEGWLLSLRADADQLVGRAETGDPASRTYSVCGSQLRGLGQSRWAVAVNPEFRFTHRTLLNTADKFISPNNSEYRKDFLYTN